MLSTAVSPQNIQSIKLSHFKYVTLENHILKSGKRCGGFIYRNNNAKQAHLFLLFLCYLIGHVHPLRSHIRARIYNTHVFPFSLPVAGFATQSSGQNTKKFTVRSVTCGRRLHINWHLSGRK